MHDRKIILAVIMVLLVLLLGIQFSSLGSRLVDFVGQSAHASELAEANVYLPLIFRNYPPPAPAYGIDLGAIQAQNGLAEMVQAGAAWVRRDGVNWAEVEPNKGQRNWSGLADLETELINADQNGLEVILIVSGTPGWAQQYPGFACGAVKPEEYGAFAAFMKDLVARYSVPPYNVKYWEIWNEPDISYQLVELANMPKDTRFGCWGDGDAPYYGGGSYGKMLAKVTPQIKLADSHAQVIVGGLLLDCDPVNNEICTSSLFIEGVLRAGGGPYFDGISFHAYDYYAGALGEFFSGWNSTWDTTGPVVIAKANYLKGLLNTPEFGAQGKFLINSETAIICGGFQDPPGTGPCDADPNSEFEKTKAYYVSKVYAIGQSLGLRASIWYNVFGWRNSGLLYGDRSPRPAYTAYSVAENALDRVFFQREITEYADVVGYEFSKDGLTLWVLWSKDGATHSITLSKLPNAAYDALGQSITPASSLDIGEEPIYLEWTN
jgi:hypothetical protein